MTKQQIIVCVGSDMTGKTEISQALSHVLGIPRFKAESEHESFLKKQDLFIQQLRYADTRMVDFLKQTGHSVIFDRAYPCEMVYAQHFNRETDLQVLRHVDDIMAYMGAKIVICVRSSFEGIQDDLDSTLKTESLTQIQKLYYKFAEWTLCNVHILNVDDENLVREVTEVLGFLGYSGDKLNDMIDEVHEYDARRRVGGCCA